MKIAHCLLIFLGVGIARVDAAGAPLDEVVITATRIAEPVARIPADIAVVAAAELVARDATNMADMLGLVPGVEAPPGGDAGPSGAVPSFWGLHEFDAFLLVVDGVPWGGAFNPAITSLNFTDIQRVEVMKGAAPVMYGATSFVGVVQVVHYPAGEASDEADLALGSYASYRASLSGALPGADGFRQSLAADGQKRGFADARERIADGHALYRAELDVAAGTLRLDADVAVVHDLPQSPAIRAGSSLTELTPIDANYNPADAKIDETRHRLALGYSHPLDAGAWETLMSYAHSDVADIRAFLEPDLSGAADSQNQRRAIDDGYVDTHVSHTYSTDTLLVAGGDLLYGHGRQTTLNGKASYIVPLSGAELPPPPTALPVNEIGTIDDRRLFTGQYAQLDWKPDDRWDLLAGVRLNETYERKFTTDLLPPSGQLLSESARKAEIRPLETVGLSYRLWGSGVDQSVAYADLRNAFKPAAIDFGPDYRPELLDPETAHSYEAGIKGAAADGRFNYEAELFVMDFHDLVVATSSGALANAGAEKLAGVELESRMRVARDFEVAVNASYHDAKFVHYLVTSGAAAVNVAGRELPLSARALAALGLLYTPERGASATLVARYVGRRFLDEENTAPAGGYAHVDATVGYRAGPYRVSLEGANLTNQRPPVSASEFGSESFYRLPARMLWVRAAYSWH